MKSWLCVAACVLLAACANTGANQSAEGNRSLAGSWRLTELESQTIPMTGGVSKLLQFEAGTNKFSGNVGCNRLFGLYESQGSDLRFSGVASTQMACDPVSMQLEQRVVRAMEGVHSWTVVGKELQLRNEQQQTVLKFQRL